MEELSVGIIIIGDEILKGQVVDMNSSFLCKEFYSLGIKVGKISMISDSIHDIASEVKILSKRFTYVITTGGVGLTHDDVTYEGVARAFNDRLILNDKMVRYYKDYCGGVVSDIETNPQLRIAFVPKMSEIIFLSTKNDDAFKSWGKFPVVKVSNVIILPGVPQLTKLCFKEITKLFFRNNSTKFYNKVLYLKCDEVNVVHALNNAVKKFKDLVVFGSYPVMNNPIFQTKLTMEATDEEQVKNSEEFLKSLLPPDDLVDPIIVNAADDIYKLIESPDKKNDIFTATLQTSVKIVEDALTKYPKESLFINFNGGKDCTVLLHLVTAVWQHLFKTLPSIHAVYFRNSDPFPEIESFIQESVKRYKLSLTITPGPIKTALSTLLAQHSEWKAGFMGTRKTDPFSENLIYFQVTDESWPKMMRINPLLEWNYSDVWKFLSTFNIPYCCLYDQGYTSLGSKDNTKPNPLLAYKNSDGITCYYPAYKLNDGKSEREGRC
ncbi:FAD synthase-like isoform X2 [Lycorma delicatula]|uniref:FAD synthase-like isoform X2 n=1 Tax=Lycorma delicatula TaxID=130591 RepID=UPI003F5162B1